MSSNLKRFIMDTGWSFSSLAIAALVQFILRILLANYFGAAELGQYTLAFTAYSFGLTFVCLGTDFGLVKYTAASVGNPSQSRILLTSGATISFISSCILGILLYIVSPYIALNFFKMPELTTLLQIVSFAFPFIAIEKAILGFLNGMRKMRAFSFINIAQNILVITLTFIFAIKGYDVKYSVISLVLPVVFVSLASLFFMRKYLHKPTRGELTPAIKMLLAFGLYVVLANGMGIIQTYIDSTLLGYYMTDVDVGVYSTAKSMLPALWLLSLAAQSITSPMIAAYWGRHEIYNIEDLVNKCIRYTAFYSILVAFLVGFLAQDLVKILFGQEFTAAAFPFQILLIGAVIGGIQASVGSALSSTAFVKINFFITGATVIVDILLNILLIPHFGITGAGVATSIVIGASSLIQLYLTQRLIKIKLDWMWLIKLVSVSFIVSLVTYLLAKVFNYYLVLAVNFTLLAYIMLRYFLNRNEHNLLKHLLVVNWFHS